MVNLDNLTSRPLDKIYTSHGYICQNCGAWEAVYHTSPSLEDSLRNLQRYAPGHPKFEHLFLKAVRKAQGVQARGDQHGAFGRTDKTSA